MANQLKYEWTIVYLIKAVDATWVDAANMFRAIGGVRHDRRVAVVCCLNTRREHLARMFPSYPTRDGADKEGEITVFLRIENELMQREGDQLELLEAPSGFDIARPEDLAAFFSSEVLQKYRAGRYALFTWDHGNGYTIFRGQENNLTAGQLAGAIRQAFGKRKIDLVIMMNCYMQLFDTCFALSSAATHLVAAETLFYDMAPFDYWMIFTALMSDPAISPANLCNTVIDSVAAVYGDKSISSVQLGVAVFASNLRYFPKLAREIDLFSLALIRALPDHFDIIRQCREKCGQVPAVAAELIDFMQFANLADQYLPSGWQMKTPFLSAILPKAVFKEFIHPVLKGSPHTGKELCASGFSICFPTCVPDRDAAENFYADYIREGAKYATDFSRRFRWKDFIAAYLETQVLAGKV